jgi:cyclic pyranopterin phosphate synthase
MVDVGDKEITHREALACGYISLQPQTLDVIMAGTAKKGDVLGTARLAGIMAVKQTPQLIPLCHRINIESCALEFIPQPEQSRIEARCRVRAEAKTGAEMEALTGAAAALLTIYDMVKAMDRGMEIHGLCLLSKSGGKSGVYQRADQL